MLANTPRHQQIIGASKGSQTSKRLNNRSMIHGSNALINENRFSKLRNSPSGQFLAHPKSRNPDHPVELLKLKQDMEDRMINPSFSITNLVQAGAFIANTPHNESQYLNTPPET